MDLERETGNTRSKLSSCQGLLSFPVSIFFCFIHLQAPGATKTIPLASLTRIEPDSKRQNCLVIQGLNSTFCILFRDNTELYTWLDALYLRSSLSTPIGMPTNFVHRVHVGLDAVTGAFTVGHFPELTVRPCSSRTHI